MFSVPTARRTKTAFLTSLALVVLLTSVSTSTGRAKPLSFVVSDNATGDEVALPTRCSYTADPPYTNHLDKRNKKLLDRHHNTAGINQPHQDVIFDLKVDCQIHAVLLEFTSNKKEDMPASVEVLLGDSPDGPWRSVDVLLKNQQKDNFWRLDVTSGHGRYLRLYHTRDKGRWFLSEVKIYGNVWQGDVVPARLQGDALILVDETKTYATIIQSDDAPGNVLEASLAFQKVVRNMTGVWLPIENESAFKGSSAVVLVGMSDLARKHGLRVKQDFRDGDHYIIRSGQDYLALVGNDAEGLRGSAYAVYDLFQQLGCGWYGPEELWQVIPKRKTLSIPMHKVATDQRPAFDMRNIWLVSRRRTGQTLVDAWRLGKRWVYDAHAMKGLVPRKTHAVEHPDWFSNTTKPRWQPCYTHPEVIELVVGKLRDRLNRDNKKLIGITISSNDNIAYCSCQRCQSVGNASAQMLYFANAVARELRKAHKGRFVVNFLAYWATHKGPRPLIKAEPEVCATFVNEGDHVQPWSEPELPHLAARGRSNTRELRDFTSWQKTGVRLAIREWWIPGCKDKWWRGVPWYSGQTAILNLRYWQKAGVRYIHYETGYENKTPLPLRWPLYYVAARGMWNPNVDSDEIMAQACQKLYGQASEDMLKFYKVLENAMSQQRLYGGKNWHMPLVHYIYSEDVADLADRHLQTAAAAADNPQSLARIQQQQKMWANARRIIAAQRKDNRGKPSFDVVVDGTTVTYYRQDSFSPTLIRLLHKLPDNTSIYIVEDGRKRLAQEAETIDLNKNLIFSTKP